MKIDIEKNRAWPTLGGRTFWTVLALSLLILPAGSADAHVALDAPNGGEVLDAGSTFMILWHDTVNHGPANYDLWFSTTGPNGPWTEIAFDRSGNAYAWTVPDTPSEQVRVRVRQDNAGTDYDDVSDSDLSIVGSVPGDSVTLDADRDATLYEGDGSLANGAGDYLFTGRTEAQNGALERRALLAFDIADAVPAGSTITSVSLELTMSRTISGAQTVGLHRVLEAWSEGSSHASGQEGGGAPAETGDATWVHSMYPDSSWATVGGSFALSASATLQIDGTGEYVYTSTPETVADVQTWLDNPSSNHGWALAMPEPLNGSAKRFNSRENGSSPSSGPRLVVAYELGLDPPTADFSFSPSSPMAGELVSFSDQSGGSPTAWLWDFGGGDGSTEQNPSHVFAGADTYTVRLTASNANGSDQTSAEITVIPEDEPELDELVIIPAAANAEGSGGAFFVTTADVFNAGSTTATFRFLWLPRGVDNSSPVQSAMFTLEPRQARRFHNLLAEVFDASATVGAVAVTSDSIELEVETRTFNQTADGTFGQSLPGVADDDLVPSGTRALLLFLTENGEFRSNLGLVNGVGTPLTLQWELFDSDGTSLGTDEVDLPAWGNVQLNRVLADFAPVEAAYAEVWTTTSGGAFTCYGSVLDELTSDPTTILPR